MGKVCRTSFGSHALVVCPRVLGPLPPSAELKRVPYLLLGVAERTWGALWSEPALSGAAIILSTLLGIAALLWIVVCHWEDKIGLIETSPQLY